MAALLAKLPIQVPVALIEDARVLDNHYVVTRCVKAHQAGAPFEAVLAAATAWAAERTIAREAKWLA